MVVTIKVIWLLGALMGYLFVMHMCRDPVFRNKLNFRAPVWVSASVGTVLVMGWPVWSTITFILICLKMI